MRAVAVASGADGLVETLHFTVGRVACGGQQMSSFTVSTGARVAVPGKEVPLLVRTALRPESAIPAI